LIIGLGLWVVYGIWINDLLILMAISIAVAINTILLILKINYSNDPISWSVNIYIRSWGDYTNPYYCYIYLENLFIAKY
jgi:hypothetical protein